MSENIELLTPKLTDEIHFNALSENFFILSNSNDKHYLKINKKVYDLLQLVDGKMNLSELSIKFNKIYNSELEYTEIHFLLYKKLLPYGILKGYESDVKPYKKPDYLKLSFVLISEKILNKITPFFLFLFKKKYAIATLITLIITYILVISYYINLYQTYNIRESFTLFIILMFVSVTFHEIGHATAARFFGAKHGGIGIGFYLFSPVYYADVTDIWKLEKTKRIAVNLSGIYFELIFNILVISIGLALGDDLLIIIALIIAFKTLFNLNPFLRSDGYWVISDLTNKPNLFYHAKQKVIEVFNFIFNRKSIQWDLVEKLLFIYGLIIYSFMSLFIYYVLFKNPNSLLYFPQNLLLFFKGIFQKDANFDLTLLANLIVPLLFIRLVYFVFIKPIFKTIKAKI